MSSDEQNEHDADYNAGNAGEIVLRGSASHPTSLATYASMTCGSWLARQRTADRGTGIQVSVRKHLDAALTHANWGELSPIPRKLMQARRIIAQGEALSLDVIAASSIALDSSRIPSSQVDLGVDVRETFLRSTGSTT